MNNNAPFASGNLTGLLGSYDLRREPSMQKSTTGFGVVSVNNILDRRTIKSSHVGTRRRAALMGQISKIEKQLDSPIKAIGGCVI